MKYKWYNDTRSSLETNQSLKALKERNVRRIVSESLTKIIVFRYSLVRNKNKHSPCMYINNNFDFSLDSSIFKNIEIIITGVNIFYST